MKVKVWNGYERETLTSGIYAPRSGSGWNKLKKIMVTHSIENRELMKIHYAVSLMTYLVERTSW